MYTFFDVLDTIDITLLLLRTTYHMSYYIISYL